MKYHAPEDVAGVLEIQPPTLRKYAQLLERYGYTFEKNKQGHRWYSDTDIIALQKLITFKHSGDMDLQAAAQAVLLWAKGGGVSGDDTLGKTIHSDTERNAEQLPQITQEQLLNIIREQQGAIEGMAQLLQKQGEQNAQILQQLNAIRGDMQRLNAPPPADPQEEAAEQPQQAQPQPPAQEQPKRRSLWAWIWRK